MKRTFSIFSLAMVFVLMISLIGVPVSTARASGLGSWTHSMENVPLSLPNGLDEAYLMDVWGSSTNNVYAVGGGSDATGTSHPVLYHHDGTDWAEASSWLPDAWDRSDLYGVWGSSESDVYVVGDGNDTGENATPIYYYYDGTDWTAYSLSLSSSFWSGYLVGGVWGSSEDDVYFGGYAYNYDGDGYRMPLVYHYDDTGWTEYSFILPDERVEGVIANVWGLDTSNVYALGRSYDASGAVYPLLYYYDGTDWTMFSFSSRGTFSGIWAFGENDVYVAGSGYNTSNAAIPLIYHYDGTDWTTTELPLPADRTSGRLTSMWAASANDMYAVGRSNKTTDTGGIILPLFYHNDGTGWVESTPSLPDNWLAGQLLSMWGFDQDHLYLVGDGASVDQPDRGKPLLYSQGGVVAETTILASVASSGVQANSSSDHPSISADGRYIAFDTYSTNLVSSDSNGASDIFVRDTQTRTTTIASVSSGEAEANGDSFNPAISADGRYVVFESIASNLVSGDNNPYEDIFLRDLQLGTTTLVSVNSNEIQGNGFAYEPSISADGRYVAFYSAAALTSGDTNGNWDVFVRDTVAGTTTLVSVSSSGVQGNSFSQSPSISPDGQYVAFVSDASNLVSGDSNGEQDVFLRNVQAGTTTRISVDSGEAQTNAISGSPSVSLNGEYVVFYSWATNLVGGDTNATPDVFLRDTVSGTTMRVSVDSIGRQGNLASELAMVSSDGRYVVFTSFATNLVSGDTNGKPDIFLRDTSSGTTRRVSLSASGLEGNNPSWSASISPDGGYVAFLSWSTNLVDGDSNGWYDVFARGAFSDLIPPTIFSITREDSDPTNAPSVGFTVTFSEPVTNVDVDDFDLDVGTSGIIGATVQAVTADATCVDFCNTYTVTVDTGSGSGSLGLTTSTDISVIDMAGNPFGEPFTAGEYYTIDKTAPAAISLTAVTGSGNGMVDLSWTAVGDDGNTPGGSASSYLVRYSTSAILTVTDWDNATVVSSVIPTPKVQGQAESMTVGGLTAGQTYYFAIRAQDEQNNLGGLSNSPSAAASNAPATAAGTYDDGNLTVWSYAGTWSTYSGSGPYSSTMHQSNTAGSYGQVTFSGIKVSLTYLKAPGRGSIDVYIDDVKVDTINASSTSVTWQAVWTSQNLTNTVHTVRFQNASGGYIDLDAVQIIAPVLPNTYDDANAAWGYSGTWSIYSGSGPYGNTMHQSNTTGSYGEVVFDGTQVKLTYLKAPGRGSIDVYIDGVKVDTIVASSTSVAWQQTWTSEVLTDEVHTVRFQNAGGGYIDLDAVQIQ